MGRLLGVENVTSKSVDILTSAGRSSFGFLALRTMTSLGMRVIHSLKWDHGLLGSSLHVSLSIDKGNAGFLRRYNLTGDSSWLAAFHRLIAAFC